MLFLQPSNIIGRAEISLLEQVLYLISNEVKCFIYNNLKKNK